MNRILVALALACALAAGACTTASRTDGTPWGQIATGVGTIVGETKIDPQIARVSARLADYCTEVQTAALAVDMFASDKVRSAAQHARIVVSTFCAAPPRNVAEALVSLAAAYSAIEAARKGV